MKEMYRETAIKRTFSAENECQCDVDIHGKNMDGDLTCIFVVEMQFQLSKL